MRIRKLPAFDKMGLPQIFTELAKASGKISFGEGDKRVEKPPVEVFADFMVGLKQIVPGGELVQPQARTGSNLVQFNEPKAGVAVIDEGSVTLAEAALAMSIKDKIPYGEALKIVRRNPEYAGAASSGKV